MSSPYPFFVAAGADFQLRMWFAVTTRCIERERLALLNFKQGLIDRNDDLSTWGGQEHNCCTWKGVSCNENTSHVIALQLPGYELRGNISRALLDLQHLNHLELSDNNFDGKEIPGFFGSFEKLQHLYLARSGFSGIIPYQLGNISNLKTLDLGRNSALEADNLDWLSNLSFLSRLDLSGIKINDTNWLRGIRGLSSLKELYLASCDIPQLTPSSLDFIVNSSSPSLVVLDLSGTELNSLVFSWLVNMSTSLARVDLSDNQLDGLIPDAFGSSIFLEYLDLSGNQLEGTVSESHFLNLHNLTVLDLSFNSLVFNVTTTTAWVPPFRLDVRKLTSCYLGPHFPKWLQTQSSISGLDLSSTKISDQVPNWLWDLSPRLQYLNLSRNQISGELPNLSSKFSGSPIIDLSSNNFSGSLPLLNPSTSILQLSRNMFWGSISSICTLRLLGFLDLSYNQLSGPLPDCWMSMGRLAILNLENNDISGEIPPSLAQLQFPLLTLQLRNNNLTGDLSSSFMINRFMTMFDVGGNQLQETSQHG
ncbi:Receptor-like protein EIX1 [Sesamum angolense]|uniref:Receptor-like protein EIX1 n=1 Tax=Sesamum angolense TaxID=2727404 RepID=A0AAE2BMR6_9LAMI|nr:Receptor-like protein EIX1 [Sesamum angolense]